MQGGTSIGAGQIQKRYAYTSTPLTLILNLTLILTLTLTLALTQTFLVPEHSPYP